MVGRVRKVNTINSTSGSAAKTDRLHHQLGLQHYEDRQEEPLHFADDHDNRTLDTLFCYRYGCIKFWIVNRTIFQCKLWCERRRTHKHTHASLLERAACLGLTCSLSCYRSLALFCWKSKSLNGDLAMISDAALRLLQRCFCFCLICSFAFCFSCQQYLALARCSSSLGLATTHTHTHADIHRYTCISSIYVCICAVQRGPAACNYWSMNMQFMYTHIHIHTDRPATMKYNNCSKRLYFWYKIHSAHIEMQTDTHTHIHRRSHSRAYTHVCKHTKIPHIHCASLHLSLSLPV